jgi:phosphoglycerate dehydrogenase-like enzyme
LLLNRAVADRHADFLAGLDGLEVIVVPEGEGETLTEAELARVEGAFFMNLPGTPSRRLLGSVRRAPNLRWLHLGHAGSDAPVFQEMMDRGIVVTNSAGVTAEPIAQSAIAGLLALNRGIPLWLDAQRRHVWELHDESLPRDLAGQTIVIVGLGSIGGRLAHYARAFGLRVVGVRRTPAGIEDGVDEWLPPDRLREALPRADVLAITVPLTSDTRGQIDASALALLPAGAVVLNVARGPIVEEGALIEALRSGRLGGAYLDVFDEEPLAAESPIWDLPNVIVSPHDAGRSAGNAARIDAVFREELQRWLRGEDSPRAVRDR